MNAKVKRIAMFIGNINMMIIGIIMLIGFGYIFFEYVIPHPTRDFVPADHSQTQVVSPSYLKIGEVDVRVIVVD